jgi:hypothetical protein
MGFFDVIAAALPWSDAEAEAVKGGASTESTPANDTESSKGASAKSEAEDEGGDAKVCFCCCCYTLCSPWECDLCREMWLWGYANIHQHRKHPTTPRIRMRVVMMRKKRMKKKRRRKRSLLILRRLLRRVSDMFLLKGGWRIRHTGLGGQVTETIGLINYGTVLLRKWELFGGYAAAGGGILRC